MVKFKVRLSFFVLFLIMIALGLAEQFFILLFSVTVHEFAHIVTANFFGLKTNEVIFTPFGETAVIKNIEIVETYKKIIIAFAGPFINIMFVILSLFFSSYEFWRIICDINFSIAVLNLLPIYPLDGGRIFQSVLGCIFGVLTSNKIVIKVSNAVNFLLILLGIIQMVLFPYNISLICVGFYLFKMSKAEYMKMTFDFYRSIINKKILCSRTVSVKIYWVSGDTDIKFILSKISFDKYKIFIICDEPGIIHKITESQIIKYIQTNGLNGTIYDIAINEKR